jgi:PhnB protein
MNNEYIPAGYRAVMPALAVKNAQAALDWYCENFGAVKKMVLKDKSGTVVHSEIIIGDSVVIVSEENPAYNMSPQTLKGNSINIMMYVREVDEVIKNSVANGARLVMAPEDQFYGDRSGRIQDPFGYIWIISTFLRHVSEKEMQDAIDSM